MRNSSETSLDEYKRGDVYDVTQQKHAFAWKTFTLRASAVCSSFALLSLFAANSNAATQNDGAHLVKQPNVDYSDLGPSKPVGHSIRNNPTLKARIEAWLRDHRIKTRGKYGSADPENLSFPPLVNASYGFEEPDPFPGMPRAVISLGESDNSYAIIVEKRWHRLSVVKEMPNGATEIIRTYRAITGKDPADKSERGDLRTPEGIYYITSKMEDHVLPSKYGRMAFVLDYPNLFDQRSRKSGYGIWIHATDNPKRLTRPFDTEGCVALSNEDIQTLAPFLENQMTPVVITQEMTQVTFEEQMQSRNAVMALVEGWRKSWENSDIEKYISYYSNAFSSNGMNKEQWREYKSSLAGERQKEIQVSISRPQIVAFEDQLVVSFFQQYQSAGHSDFGRKFLFIKWENDRYRVVAERWSPTNRLPQSVTFLPSRNPQGDM